MRLKVNWARFALCFLTLQSIFLLAGCTAAWLGAVSALLPSLEAVVSAIISFVLALEGKTISAATSATIQKIGNDIAAEITQVQTLIAEFKAAASTGLLSQIQAILNAIVTNLGAILSSAGITDSATVSKLVQLVGLAVAAAQAIIALIPLVIGRMNSGASKAELEADDKIAAKSITSADKAVKETYTAIVTAHTTSADVNSALDSLPRSI